MISCKKKAAVRAVIQLGSRVNTQVPLLLQIVDKRTKAVAKEETHNLEV